MYSNITRQDSTVITPYIESTNDKNYLKYHKLCSGVILSGTDVYSITSGHILLANKNEQGLYTIMVQQYAHQGFAYCLLDTICVNFNDIVLEGVKLGTCKKQMRFEYLNTSKGTSPWAVRVMGITYYKHDPMDIAIGKADMNRKIPISSGYNIQTIFRDGGGSK